MKEPDYSTKIRGWNSKGAIEINIAHKKSLRVQKLHELLAKIYQEELCTQVRGYRAQEQFCEHRLCIIRQSDCHQDALYRVPLQELVSVCYAFSVVTMDASGRCHAQWRLSYGALFDNSMGDCSVFWLYYERYSV